MKRVTTEDFERLLESGNAKKEKEKKGIKVLEVLTIVMVPISFILLANLSMPWIVEALLFLILVLSPLIVHIILIYIIELKKLGTDLFKKIRFQIKYSEHNAAYMEQLHTDNILNKYKELVNAEKSSYNKILLLELLISILNFRCEFGEAEKYLAIVKQENEKLKCKQQKVINSAELAIMESTEKKEEYCRFIEKLSDEADEPANIYDCYNDAVHFCQYEIFSGNYQRALEYAELLEEYQEKIFFHGKSILTNSDKYLKVTVKSTVAQIYAELGDIENARTYFDMANKIASQLTCGIPEIFIRDFKRVAEKIQ